MYNIEEFQTSYGIMICFNEYTSPESATLIINIITNIIDKYGYLALKPITYRRGIRWNGRLNDLSLNNIALLAAKNWHINVVKYILQYRQIPVNTSSLGWYYWGYLGYTPLMIAILSNRTDVVKCLLKRFDINVFIQDSNSKNALQLAYEKGHYKCLGPLLKYGHLSCKNWKYWYGPEEKIKKTITIMKHWRSFLPEWSYHTHKRYSKEFKNIVITFLCILNQLEKRWKIKFYKDIRHLLIQYIAKKWRKIVE